jgi:hypothetical protein
MVHTTLYGAKRISGIKMTKPELLVQLYALREDAEWDRYITMPDGQSYCHGEGVLAQHRPAIIFADYKAEVLALMDKILELASDHRLYCARNNVSQAQNMWTMTDAFVDVDEARRKKN